MTFKDRVTDLLRAANELQAEIDRLSAAHADHGASLAGISDLEAAKLGFALCVAARAGLEALNALVKSREAPMTFSNVIDIKLRRKGKK